MTIQRVTTAIRVAPISLDSTYVNFGTWTTSKFQDLDYIKITFKYNYKPSAFEKQQKSGYNNNFEKTVPGEKRNTQQIKSFI